MDDAKTQNSGDLLDTSYHRKRLARRLAEDSEFRVFFEGALAKIHADMGPKHGSRTSYNQGCRCDDCRAANAAYKRGYRAAGGKS